MSRHRKLSRVFLSPLCLSFFLAVALTKFWFIWLRSSMWIARYTAQGEGKIHFLANNRAHGGRYRSAVRRRSRTPTSSGCNRAKLFAVAESNWLCSLREEWRPALLLVSSWLSKPEYECHVTERRRVFRSRGGVTQFHIRAKYCAQTLISYSLPLFFFPTLSFLPLSALVSLSLSLASFLFLVYPLLLLFRPPFTIAISLHATWKE